MFAESTFLCNLLHWKGWSYILRKGQEDMNFKTCQLHNGKQMEILGKWLLHYIDFIHFIPIQIFQSNQFLNRKGAFSEPIDMSKKTLLVTWEKPIESRKSMGAPGDLYILASYHVHNL